MLTKEVPLFKNNKTIGVMAFGIDITERKQFEDALKESEENFAVSSRSPMMVFMCFRMIDSFLLIHDILI